LENRGRDDSQLSFGGDTVYWTYFPQVSRAQHAKWIATFFGKKIVRAKDCSSTLHLKERADSVFDKPCLCIFRKKPRRVLLSPLLVWICAKTQDAHW
jgi:Zn-finger protein